MFAGRRARRQRNPASPRGCGVSATCTTGPPSSTPLDRRGFPPRPSPSPSLCWGTRGPSRSPVVARPADSYTAAIPRSTRPRNASDVAPIPGSVDSRLPATLSTRTPFSPIHRRTSAGSSRRRRGLGGACRGPRPCRSSAGHPGSTSSRSRASRPSRGRWPGSGADTPGCRTRPGRSRRATGRGSLRPFSGFSVFSESLLELTRKGDRPPMPDSLQPICSMTSTALARSRSAYTCVTSARAWPRSVWAASRP